MSLLILHIHSQRCTRCGTTSRWSNLYEPHASGAATRMQPFASQVPDGMAIETTQLPEVRVPMCFACVPSNVDAAAAAKVARVRFEETKARKRHEALYEANTASREQSQQKKLLDLA
jgi:hypothetical protein